MTPKAHIALALSQLPTCNHVARVMGHAAGEHGGPIDPVDLFRAWHLMGQAIRDRMPPHLREFIEGVGLALGDMLTDLETFAKAEEKSKEAKRRRRVS